jgi:hypothetical protein
MKTYRLSEADRQLLENLLRQDGAAPPVRPRSDGAIDVAVDENEYWAKPPAGSGIPGAVSVGGVVTPSGVYCAIYKRKLGEPNLVQMKYPDDTPVLRPVYNYSPVGVMDMSPISQHNDGTWVVGATPTRPSRNCGCSGYGVWVADSNLIWQWPTGQCGEATTTAAPTTTGEPTTTSTTTDIPVPTTPSSFCQDYRCMLVCGTPSPPTAAPTTTGSGTTSEAPPTTTFAPGLIYYLASGASCPGGCTCYGLGDPCWEEAAEVLSVCKGVITTLPPTTWNPSDTACQWAVTAIGTIPPLTRRYARKMPNEAWSLCGPTLSFHGEIYPLGFDQTGYKKHDNEDKVGIYQTGYVLMAAKDSAVTDKKLIYAMSYSGQTASWSGSPYIITDAATGTYRVYWESTGESLRPIGHHVPPVWLPQSPTADYLKSVGITQINSSVYAFDASFAGEGRYGDEVLAEGFLQTPVLTQPQLARHATVSSPGNCGFVRPDFCPTSAGECWVGPCAPGANHLTPTDQICFLDKWPRGTTTNGPFLLPCVDVDGNICNCPTTFPPAATSACPPTTSLGPVPCAGYCEYLSDGVRWNLTKPGCSSELSWCGCAQPSCEVAAPNSKTYTLCYDTRTPTTSAPTCKCCTPTTTIGPTCSHSLCHYEVSAGKWSLVTGKGTCPPECPCPEPETLLPPIHSCSKLKLRCGPTPDYREIKVDFIDWVEETDRKSPFFGKKKATGKVFWATNVKLLGKTVTMYDHWCILDLPSEDFNNFRMIASWGVTESTACNAAPGDPTPFHWSLTDRCCEESPEAVTSLDGGEPSASMTDGPDGGAPDSLSDGETIDGGSP